MIENNNYFYKVDKSLWNKRFLSLKHEVNIVLLFKCVSLSELIICCCLCSSLLLVVHEDNQEPLEQDNGIEVDSQRLVHGIPVSLGLRIVDDLLDIIKSESAEKEEASVEPDIKKGLAWPEHLSNRDTD